MPGRSGHRQSQPRHSVPLSLVFFTLFELYAGFRQRITSTATRTVFTARAAHDAVRPRLHHHTPPLMNLTADHGWR